MTAHEKIEAGPGTALALPTNIGDLAQGRDRAIEIWLSMYDSFHAGREAAGQASVGGRIALQAGSDRYGDTSLTEAFLHSGEREIWKDHARVKISSRDEFERLLTRSVDRRCWRDLMETTGFERLLDHQAREEFEASLNGEEVVPFTAENCLNTFGHLWENRRDIWLRGIANVFMAMDRRFRSHDAFEIGNRLVLSYAFSKVEGSGAWVSNSWSERKQRDRLHDVERVFRELEGFPPLGYGQGMAEMIAQSGIGRTEGRYFKADRFKNGNVHLWFTRKDLLEQVNKLLLEYYKPVEGDVADDGPSYASGPLFHSTPAKNYGAFFSSEAVADEVMSRAEISTSRYDRELGKVVERTPRVLEPSAGNGVLARAARAKGAAVTCVEIQEGYAHELRLQGFDTRCADFLKLEPSAFGELFDYVVMNPPFDRGRDCDHVRHAFRFLKPGGTLVAVMSARAEHCEDARHTALHELIRRQGDRWGWAWRDLPERSFAHAGTNVNTVTLKIVKKGD